MNFMINMVENSELVNAASPHFKLSNGFQLHFKNSFIYFILAGSLLLCGLSLVAASRVYSLVSGRRLLIAVASLLSEHGRQGV